MTLSWQTSSSSAVAASAVDIRIDRPGAAFAIVIHHDARHTFKYCKALLREVFDLSDEDACTHCWKITTQGRASVWIGEHEEAVRLCKLVESYQQRLDEANALKVDNDLDAGHPPLSTTIERVSQHN